MNRTGTSSISSISSSTDSIGSVANDSISRSKRSDGKRDSERDEESLKEVFAKLKVDCNSDMHYYDTECNKFQLKKELVEREYLSDHEHEHDYLYPNLNDAKFNIKIASKKEFNDTQYDGTIHADIKKHSDEIANAEYELQPHQAFVKNFMSNQTPYSSLLLYHGLGTGKTCSAIGVCEDHREFMKQTGSTKRIIIVATENVQDNFKLQLFDERKLVEVNSVWTMQGCVGNKLLREINPMNVSMSKEKVISSIKSLINSYYIFMGYIQFANYIIKTMSYVESLKGERNKEARNKEITEIQKAKERKTSLNEQTMRRLQQEFNDRLIVIDEIHNIRKTDGNTQSNNHMIATNLELLVRSAKNMRLLFLSATPMYNSYKEIIWLLNLMNMNDKRGKIEVGSIFDELGNFKPNGEEILIRKSTGYVSFVKGENPYTFPYRVYPNTFDPSHSLKQIEYPDVQMNMKTIKSEDKIKLLDLYVSKLSQCASRGASRSGLGASRGTSCGNCQLCCYNYIIYCLNHGEKNIVTKQGKVIQMPNFKDMDSFGYTKLMLPIESLIISYPPSGDRFKQVMETIQGDMKSNESDTASSMSKQSQKAEELDDTETDDIEDSVVVSDNDGLGDSKRIGDRKRNIHEHWFDPAILTGKQGLERMVSFEETKDKKHMFEYRGTERIFAREHIGKYSAKIKSVLDNLDGAEGIALIYSNYIDGGIIPMALALEEAGYSGYFNNLFKSTVTGKAIATDKAVATDKAIATKHKYCIITGDAKLSPDNDALVKILTNVDNKDGSKIKVILISKAGSEGIDFKFIRQIHILDPWYNMNRSEQVIGRGVRNLSHKDLEFEKRNVSIFLHCIVFDNSSVESADLYIYRFAEYKAIQIGKVTRVLKESAVDCIINHGQTKFTQQKMAAALKSNITQILYSGKTLTNFKIGDAPFSPSCDYMASCNYNCRPITASGKMGAVNEDTYDESFITMNSEKITKRIRMLFKEAFFYRKDVLMKSIRATKEYPYIQIYSALTHLIEDESEVLLDKYDRTGRLVNIGDYYLFQPTELTDSRISIYERSTLPDYKMDYIEINLKPSAAHAPLKAKKEKVVNDSIMIRLRENLNISKEWYSNAVSLRGDDNWFKHCGIAMHKLEAEMPESKPYFELFVVSHEIEMMDYDEKIKLMNYLYSLEQVSEQSAEYFAKEYFNTQTVSVSSELLVFIAYKGEKRVILKWDNGENVWNEATPSDQVKISKSDTFQKFLCFDPSKTKEQNKIHYKSKYNSIVGYMSYEKALKTFGFKTKALNAARDTGASCANASKKDNLSKLNKIFGQPDKYTNENTKLQKNSDGTIIREAIANVELCLLVELTLRYFNAIQKDNMRWFMSPEVALYHFTT